MSTSQCPKSFNFFPLNPLPNHNPQLQLSLPLLNPINTFSFSHTNTSIFITKKNKTQLHYYLVSLMSTTAPPPSTTVTTTTTTAGVGLGYGIAIAVSILVLISTIMLASYICVRLKSQGRRNSFHLDTRLQNVSINGSGVQSELPGPFILGLEIPEIESYPKMLLGESMRLPKPNEGPCSICLNDYLPKEAIRCVPDCQHCFHAECVDEWLQMSATCPLCRNSPAPSPVATPLSELVPLAFHAR